MGIHFNPGKPIKPTDAAFVDDCNNASHDDASRIRALIDRYRSLAGNDAGGSLHIVLDDGNRDRCCVLLCYQCALENGDTAGAALAGVLLCLPDPIFEAALA